MAQWLDMALLDHEADLQTSLEALAPAELEALIAEVEAALGVSHAEVLRGTARMLIERARPFALPGALWRRPLDETSSVRGAASQHLAALGIPETDQRVRRMQNLYQRFATERARLQVTARALERQSYACSHCGLRFYNDELAELGLTSPLGNRARHKTDTWKPHWGEARYRRPTVDHIWPVSTYGDNSDRNQSVICSGCNTGKANYISLHQTKVFVGMTPRKELREGGAIGFETFYAQVWRQRSCRDSGRTAGDVELTIRLRNPNLPPVLDNLETIASEEPA